MKSETGELNEGSMSEAEVDQTLDESFPACDPPSLTLGTDTHPLRDRGNIKPEDETGIAPLQTLNGKDS